MRGQENRTISRRPLRLVQGAIVQQAAKQPFYFCKGVLIRREIRRIFRHTQNRFFLDVGSGGGEFSQQLYQTGHDAIAADSAPQRPVYLEKIAAVPYMNFDYGSYALSDRGQARGVRLFCGMFWNTSQIRRDSSENLSRMMRHFFISPFPTRIVWSKRCSGVIIAPGMSRIICGILIFPPCAGSLRGWGSSSSLEAMIRFPRSSCMFIFTCVIKSARRWSEPFCPNGRGAGGDLTVEPCVPQ